jgi:hypothetical protein
MVTVRITKGVPAISPPRQAIRKASRGMRIAPGARQPKKAAVIIARGALPVFMLIIA